MNIDTLNLHSLNGHNFTCISQSKVSSYIQKIWFYSCATQCKAHVGFPLTAEVFNGSFFTQYRFENIGSKCKQLTTVDRYSNTEIISKYVYVKEHFFEHSTNLRNSIKKCFKHILIMWAWGTSTLRRRYDMLIDCTKHRQHYQETAQYFVTLGHNIFHSSCQIKELAPWEHKRISYSISSYALH